MCIQIDFWNSNNFVQTSMSCKIGCKSMKGEL
jgi:hypothetical protein